MRSFPFWEFSPSGNVTVFLEADPGDRDRAFHCGNVIGRLGAEQAGFVDVSRRHLAMGGGEFCGNACRAFAALLALLNPSSRDDASPLAATMTIAGFPWPVSLEARGKAPAWRTRVSFPLGEARIVRIAPDLTLVTLPGITHLLARAPGFPEEAAIQGLARELLAKTGLDGAGAAGVIWWRDTGNELEILPWVRVLEPFSAMIESSCGSGSIAVALAFAKGRESVRARQPSGEYLDISFAGNEVTMAGEVRLLARGEIWLDTPV